MAHRMDTQHTKERNRRIEKLINIGFISDPSDIPEDTIPIDSDHSTLAQTWSPALYYRDIHFECIDCGKEECWTAESQMHYFELVKAAPYKQAVRCHDCRKVELARKKQARRDSGVEEES